MRKIRIVGSAIVVAVLSAAPAQAAIASDVSGMTAVRLLAAHNRERVRLGIAPLRWDPALAAAAASYGPALARLGRLQHSPRAGREGQRENLWMGTRGSFSPEQMVGNWIAERANYRPGMPFPYVSRTGNWADVAHYTQVVWRGTTRVGCAIYPSRRWDYLICRYSPPGNIDGRRVA
jgi:Cysteine-rich secretory protein family